MTSAVGLRAVSASTSRHRSVERSVERWAAALLGDIEHERRVRRTARRLFDLLSPLHELRARHRRLLSLAALVHDSGRSVDDRTHPRQGARLILEAESLPLRPSERRALARLTRHHRGKPVPAAAKSPRKARERQILLTLLAMLRAADALDSRVLDAPTLDFTMQGRRLTVLCEPAIDSRKARRIFTRRKKFRLLEERLDCRVDVTIVPARRRQAA